MLLSRVCIAIVLNAAVTVAHAADSRWLIASDSETVRAGRDFELQLIRPSEDVVWPESLHLRVMPEQAPELLVQLKAVDDRAGGLRRRYSGKLGSAQQGLMRAELAEVSSNRLALVAVDDGIRVEPLSTSPIVLAPSSEADEEEAGEPQTVTLDSTQLPALGVNEPMYLVFGRHGEARFQLSFNYRLFSPEGPVVKLAPLLKGLHFGYTQNSFWDLGEDSKPFRDTSYRPSLFWQGAVEGPRWLPKSWKTGYEHESNGKEDEDSRSIDTLFFEPRWEHAFDNGSVLSFYPRIRAYLDKEENPDIDRYRGYVTWTGQYGWEGGWKLTLNYLQGTAGYASGQIDASYPIGTELFSNIGSFIHFQYFSGYGETLLNYNERKSDQFRIGISIVR